MTFTLPERLVPTEGYALNHWYSLALGELPKGERGGLASAERARTEHIRSLERKVWHQFVETGNPKLLRLNKEIAPYLLGERPSANDERIAWDHWAGVESAMLFSRQRAWAEPAALVEDLYGALRQRNPSAQRSLVALFFLEAFIGVRRAYRQSVGANYEAQLVALDGYLRDHRDSMRQVLWRALKGVSPEQSIWKRARAIDTALSLGTRFDDPRIVFEPLSAKDVRDRLTKLGVPMPRHGFGSVTVDILQCTEQLGKRLTGLSDRELLIPQIPSDLEHDKAVRAARQLCLTEHFEDAELAGQGLLDRGESFGASLLAYIYGAQRKSDLAMAYGSDRVRNGSQVAEDYWNLSLHQDDQGAIETLAVGLIRAPSYPSLLRLLDLSVRHRKPEVSAYLMLLPLYESALFSAALYQEHEAFIALDWMRRNGEPTLPNPALNHSEEETQELIKTLRISGYPRALEFWMSCLRRPVEAG